MNLSIGLSKLKSDTIVEKTNGKLKKEEKTFEKVGIPEPIETDQIEDLLQNI